MNSHEETTNEFEKKQKELRAFIEELKAHYPDHMLKVVLDNHPDCSLCQALINRGLVVQDEGKLAKGLVRTVQSFGNEAYLLVPKSWLGKKAKVSLIA